MTEVRNHLGKLTALAAEIAASVAAFEDSIRPDHDGLAHRGLKECEELLWTHVDIILSTLNSHAALLAQNAALKAALEPLAIAAEHVPDNYHPTLIVRLEIRGSHALERVELTVADLWRARDAMRSLEVTSGNSKTEAT